MSRRDDLITAARGIVDDEGSDALTMRRLAERLGMKAPSVYKHVPDKQELEAAVSARTLEELADALATARDLDELARAYRRYALAHRHLYGLMSERWRPPGSVAESLEARVAGPIVAAAGTVDRARAVWAFIHGMVQLELAGHFLPSADLDATWQEGIAAFIATARAPGRAVIRSVRGPD